MKLKFENLKSIGWNFFRVKEKGLPNNELIKSGKAQLETIGFISICGGDPFLYIDDDYSGILQFDEIKQIYDFMEKKIKNFSKKKIRCPCGNKLIIGTLECPSCGTQFNKKGEITKP